MDSVDYSMKESILEQARNIVSGIEWAHWEIMRSVSYGEPFLYARTKILERYNEEGADYPNSANGSSGSCSKLLGEVFPELNEKEKSQVLKWSARRNRRAKRRASGYLGCLCLANRIASRIVPQPGETVETDTAGMYTVQNVTETEWEDYSTKANAIALGLYRRYSTIVAIPRANGSRVYTSSRARSRRSPVRSAAKSSGDGNAGEDSDGSDPEPPKLKYHPLAALSLEGRRAA